MPDSTDHIERLRQFSAADRRLLDVLFFDLRSPLNALQGLVEIIALDLESGGEIEIAQMRELVDEATASGKRLIECLDTAQQLRKASQHGSAKLSPQDRALHDFAAEYEELFRVLNHDLRSPASLVLGSLVLMREMLDDDDLDRAGLNSLVDVVRTSAENLMRLLDRLQVQHKKDEE